MSTPAVVFFIFWSSHKVSKSDDFVLYSASPLIVDLNGDVHCTMTIPYNLFVSYINISSWSMYRLTRISHIFILIFDSSSFYVRSSGMWLVSKFVTGLFRLVIISTISSAFLKFFRTKLFRTSWKFSNVTPCYSLVVIRPRTTFRSGVSALKSFCSDQLAPLSLPYLKFPFLFILRVFPV